MKRLVVAGGLSGSVLVWMCLWGAPALRAQPPQRPAESGQAPVLFVLDASGSMAEQFGGVSRMAAARLMLQEQLARLHANTAVGLVAYGNRIPGCGSVRIYAPIRADNRASLRTQVDRMQPAGSTPIARTLRLIGEIVIPQHPGTTVVLISDGAESCGGNPAAEARKLLARGKNIQINVIGLAVDQSTALELSDIARAGQGRYFPVENHTDLDRAIQLSLRRNASDSVAYDFFKSEKTPASRPGNRAVEERWSLPGAPEIVTSTPRLAFEITAVRARGDDGDWRIFEVEYRFFHQRSGNFLVRIHAVQQAGAPGPGGRVRAGDQLLATAAGSHYAVPRASGRVELRIPADYAGPLLFQGELWETSNMPDHLHVSNAVEARRTP